MRIGSKHRRNRLADVTHLSLGEDRLVVEGWAVVGLCDDRADVGGGDDAPHTGNRLRLTRIDATNAGVRDGAAANLGVQHAGQTQGYGCIRQRR